MQTVGTKISKAKLAALRNFLGCAPEELEPGYMWMGEFATITDGKREWLVLSDREADRACKLYIEDSLWAFRAEFLVNYIPGDIDPEDLKPLQEKCESANPLIRSMVGSRFSRLVKDAVSADGRGHFLASYDDNEDEEGRYYIYRLN